ncbi:MAG TPA: DUF4388 domain-containing protein [Thermoanaerobaculia bacterium]|nr:DUF4388 domain-containing protein [Thermoanaerobaculia bacterium]
MSAVPTTRSTALEGDLDNLALPELIQFFHLQGRDGVLAVIGPDGSPLAALWYQGRQVVHALAFGLEGADAVYAALTITRGRFEFVLGHPSPPPRTIHENVQNLILEGFRRLTGGWDLEAVLPADDQPLFVAPEPPQDDIRLTAKEWSILSLVNGKRTIRQLIEATGRPEDDVRSVLAGLLTADLVLKERDSAYLERIIPQVSREGGVRFAAPTLLGTLILKKTDGTKSLRGLLADLGVAEERFLEDFRLLVRHGRITLAAGEEEYRRYVESA